MKKIKFCACVMSIAIAAVLFAKANSETPIQKEALLISNVEALCESFEWANTWWNDFEKHDYGSDWKPVKEVCTIWTNVSVPGGFDPFLPIQEPVGTGYLVNCKNGAGNCIVGTFICRTS